MIRRFRVAPVSYVSLSLSSYVCLPLSPNSVRYNIVMRLSALRKMHQLFRGKYLLRLSCPACLGMRVMGLSNDKTFPGFNVQTPRCKSSCRKNGYCLYRTKELNTAVIWHLRRCICLMNSPARQLFNFYLFRASTKCAVRSRDTHRLPEPFVA